jgi:hypothetical protein
MLVRRVLEVLAGAAAPEAAAGPDMVETLRQFEPFLQTLAAVALGDETQREEAESLLPQFEQANWRIADATRRIWAGERDAAALCEGIDPNSAMLVRRVLEVLEGAG